MRQILHGPFVRLLDRIALRVWARRLQRAKKADPDALRKIMKRVLPLRALLDATGRTASNRMSKVGHLSQIHPLPSRTNWTWQPDLALVPDTRAGESIGSDTAVSTDLRLFRDGTLAEIGLQQNVGTGGRPGITTEIYEFDGSYISFAVALPTEAMVGLRSSDLFRVEIDLEIERPVELSVRLNLRHGPNTEQIVRRIDISKGERMIEFDISYTAFNPERSRDIWIDIIFDHPRMNRIGIRDVQILRRGRSDI